MIMVVISWLVRSILKQEWQKSIKHQQPKKILFIYIHVAEIFTRNIALNEVLSMQFLNWDSLHARLNSHYKAWSNKKKKYKNIKA